MKSNYRDKYARFILFSLLLLVATSSSYAANQSWELKTTVQSYYQTYKSSVERDSAFNVGIYVSADYLDSANVSVGYNRTTVDFTGDAELTEDLFFLSGLKHFYLDVLPGKLTGRFDVYFGGDTLTYPLGSTPPTHRGGHMISPSTDTEESSDTFTYYPQLSFINYANTLYADIGYAHSEYDGATTIKADQFSPAIGFGWNDSFDWLHVRGYFIKIKNAGTIYNDDEFQSLEAVYTHWIPQSKIKMEFIRFSVLAGERVLAVDPDAAVVYSTADKQTGAVSGSIQWKLSETSKILGLASYSQFENDAINDKYDSLLLYINLQHQL